MKRIVGRIIQLFAGLAFVVAAFLVVGIDRAQAATGLITCLAPVHSEADVAELKASPEKLDCSGDQRKYGPGDFLVQLRFAPVVSQISDPLVLRLTSVWQDAATVTFHYADGWSRPSTWCNFGCGHRAPSSGGLGCNL